MTRVSTSGISLPRSSFVRAMPLELPSVNQLRRVAATTWPDRKLRSFRVVQGGWANLILEADGELIFRFPRRVDVARSLSFEVRVLDYLSRHIATPVPTPLRVGTLDDPPGWPFLVYEKLPGVPLNEYRPLHRHERPRLRRFVARLLTELASLPANPLRRIGCKSGTPHAWGEVYVNLQQRYERVGAAIVSRRMNEAIQAQFDEFFSILKDSRYCPVLSHRDLGSYNILWDPERGEPTGVLDWEDARLGDPAFDLVGLLPFGVAFWRPLRKIRKSPIDRLFDRRLQFYRTIRFLPELLHAVQAHQPKLARRKLRDLRTDLGQPT
jgi:aminoglycoside 2''-phosphotransferase